MCFGEEFRCFGVKDWFLRSSFEEMGEVGGGLYAAGIFCAELSKVGWGLAKRLIEAARVVFM